jgi:hypothetical protein
MLDELNIEKKSFFSSINQEIFHLSIRNYFIKKLPINDDSYYIGTVLVNKNNEIIMHGFGRIVYPEKKAYLIGEWMLGNLISGGYFYRNFLNPFEKYKYLIFNKAKIETITPQLLFKLEIERIIYELKYEKFRIINYLLKPIDKNLESK